MSHVPRRVRRTTAALGALALAAAGMAGCSSQESGAKKEAAPSPSATGTTRPGSQLGFGSTATVPYTAEGKQATLRITVRSVDRSTMQDFRSYQLDKQTRTATPYYVRYSVRNVTKPATDPKATKAASIGGTGVPLYALTNRNTLVQSSSFTNDFKKCPSSKLPAKFGPGRSQQGCLVYLAPEGVQLVGVSYRPDMKVAGIVWKGQVQSSQRAAKSSTSPETPSKPKQPASKNAEKPGKGQR